MPATEDGHEAAAEALALAFADDPAWAHLLPDPASRAGGPPLREMWRDPR